MHTFTWCWPKCWDCVKRFSLIIFLSLLTFGEKDCTMKTEKIILALLFGASAAYAQTDQLRSSIHQFVVTDIDDVFTAFWGLLVTSVFSETFSSASTPSSTVDFDAAKENLLCFLTLLLIGSDVGMSGEVICGIVDDVVVKEWQHDDTDATMRRRM